MVRTKAAPKRRTSQAGAVRPVKATREKYKKKVLTASEVAAFRVAKKAATSIQRWWVSRRAAVAVNDECPISQAKPAVPFLLVSALEKNDNSKFFVHQFDTSAIATMVFVHKDIRHPVTRRLLGAVEIDRLGRAMARVDPNWKPGARACENSEGTRANSLIRDSIEDALEQLAEVANEMLDECERCAEEGLDTGPTMDLYDMFEDVREIVDYATSIPFAGRGLITCVGDIVSRIEQASKNDTAFPPATIGWMIEAWKGIRREVDRFARISETRSAAVRNLLAELI